MTTQFEKNKSESIMLLSTASLLDAKELEPAQISGVFVLLTHLRAELYKTGEKSVIDTWIVEEIDKAIKRLFK